MAVGRPGGCLQPGRSEACAGSRHKLWKLCFVCLFYVFIYLELDSRAYFIFSGDWQSLSSCVLESLLFFVWVFFADVAGQAVKESSNETLSFNY